MQSKKPTENWQESKHNEYQKQIKSKSVSPWMLLLDTNQQPPPPFDVWGGGGNHGFYFHPCKTRSCISLALLFSLTPLLGGDKKTVLAVSTSEHGEDYGCCSQNCMEGHRSGRTLPDYSSHSSRPLVLLARISKDCPYSLSQYGQ